MRRHRCALEQLPAGLHQHALAAGRLQLLGHVRGRPIAHDNRSGADPDPRHTPPKLASACRLAALFAVGWAFRHSGAAGALHTLSDLIAASPLKDAHAKLMKIVPVATWFLYAVAERLIGRMRRQHALTRRRADGAVLRSMQPGHVDARHGRHPRLLCVRAPRNGASPTVIRGAHSIWPPASVHGAPCSGIICFFVCLAYIILAAL